MSIRGFRSTAVVTLLTVALTRPTIVGAEKSQQLIVKCAKPCAGAIGAVAAVGGETTYSTTTSTPSRSPCLPTASPS
jgi:hypothetical protein